jgi:glycerophosphoryl diester phosphodiesterase
VRRALLALLVLVAGALGVAVLVARPAPPQAFFAAAAHPVEAIAHRGGRGLRPENTLAAFEHAAALGVDVMEMDLRATADGEIVVLHDATVDRTTDGHGPVAALELAELQKLDAGYRWSADGGRTFPFRGKGIRVPALAEVFARFPRARMNIEIKPGEPAFAVALCALVRRSGKTEQVLVASMQDGALEAFRGACPEVATSMGPGEGRRFYAAHFVHLTAALSPQGVALQAPYRIGGRELLTAGLVAAARGRNVRVHAWTVNEEAVMRRLIAIGIDGIITDRPDVLLRLLGRPAGAPGKRAVSPR